MAVQTKRKTWTKAAIKRSFAKAYEQKGAPLTSTDTGKGNPYDLPSYATIVKHFGTWAAAGRAIKMPPAVRGGTHRVPKESRPMSVPGTMKRISADTATEVAALNLSISVLTRQRDKLTK